MRAALAHRRFVALNPLSVAAGVAVALALALRLFARPSLPFWLDEAWTGAIIAQPSVFETLRQTLLDANAPLYFALVHLWSLALGLSNEALRFPSLLFGTLTALLALIPAQGISRDSRLIWCALLALWFPGILYSQEARCYTLLLFLCAASMIAHARLLAQPDLRRAVSWAAVGALAILTHYHALILIGLQGLAYLAAHRGRALRTWPAALLFLPAFAWLFVHLPHVAEYADPRFAWFDRLGVGDVPPLMVYMFGGPLIALGLIAVAMIALVLRTASANLDVESAPYPWLVVAPAALGAAFLLAVAMASTSFTPRYLIPFVPGLLLGIAIAAAQAGRRAAVLPLAVVLVFATSAVSRAIEGRDSPAKVYNFQGASDTLMAAGVRRVAFFWDNPLNQLVDRGQLAALGGFFFQRAGVPVLVEPLPFVPGDDPSARLLAAAAAHSNTAILWLYDYEVRGTGAISHPPAIEARDPAWQCRQFGMGRIGVVACTRR